MDLTLYTDSLAIEGQESWKRTKGLHNQIFSQLKNEVGFQMGLPIQN